MSTMAAIEVVEFVPKKQLTLLQQQHRLGLWMTLPAQLLLLFIVLFPMAMQIYLSMSYWGPTEGGDWTRAYESFNWFDNYATLVSDEEFWHSIRRTLLIMAIAVPLEFLFGLGLAVLFVDQFRGRRFFYTVLLTPMMMVPAVAGYMFFMLFQSNGPINQMLSLISGQVLEPVWLSEPVLAVAAVVTVDVWQWTPLMLLILLAGLLSVPQDQLTAATMLGANSWQRFIHISLPRMKGVITIALALRTIEAFKLFDVPFTMTKGGPGTTTETISHYIYKKTFNDLDWAYVAAIGLSILLFLSVIAMLSLRLMSRRQTVREAVAHGGH
jgi:multiple sugar transport system permease protein